MADLIPEVRIIVQLKDRIRELEALLDDCYESGRVPTSDELDALKVPRATLDRRDEHG